MNPSDEAYRRWLDKQAQAEAEREQRRKARNLEGVAAKLAERRRTTRGPYAHLTGHAWFAGNGHLGGEARAKNLSPERRTEIARLGGKARWRKAREQDANERH